MESISFILGFASGFGACEKHSEFQHLWRQRTGLLFHPAVAPVDSSSFQPTLDRGHGGYMGGDGKVARHTITAPRKQALRLGFVCRRSTRKCSY